MKTVSFLWINLSQQTSFELYTDTAVILIFFQDVDDSNVSSNIRHFYNDK